MASAVAPRRAVTGRPSWSVSSLPVVPVPYERNPDSSAERRLAQASKSALRESCVTKALDRGPDGGGASSSSQSGSADGWRWMAAEHRSVG
ncbi:hypothetical protein [Actinokineospora xionganensis]|uniref:Uncharacterized protein n=1 Tax=Actinokineospora xionganensis TaxID=2684470 RepID=A0ABR7L5U0_9PSEU|nr:hypothetical protein [Actinokineospora xionganensis]MBC6448040.1 hypothetical protein [Actinokineospora xionganensis]